MTKKLLLAALAASLVGCTATPKVPPSVEIPVAAQCPVPELPTRPQPRDFVPAASASDAEKARGVALYIKSLSGYADALESLLAGYKKEAK